MTTNNSARVLESPVGGQATQIGEALPPKQLLLDKLPDEPLVTIESSSSWAVLDFFDLWAHRELLYFLIWRDIKIRYKQTVLGVAWVVLQPLLTTLVFTVFLGVLVRVPSDGIPYPLFAFSGLLLWTFFANALTASSNSIVSNAHLITKVYFPRSIIPIAAVAARLLDFAVAFAIFVGMLIYYRVDATWHMLMLPVPLALVMLLALSLGMWSSALNVKYRDVGVMIPLGLQLGMFISPVAYPSSLIPHGWRWLYILNPMAGVIANFRASLFGQSFDWLALLVSALITLVFLFYSAYAFSRMERSFADIV